MRYNVAGPFLLIIYLGSCTVTPPKGDNRPAIDLAGRTAGKPQSCVSLTPSEALTILDHESVGFRSGDTIWVNRLGPTCLGLDPTNGLIVETYGSQRCRGDHIRVIEHPQSIPGPICVLGDFVPYRTR